MKLTFRLDVLDQLVAKGGDLLAHVVITSRVEYALGKAAQAIDVEPLHFVHGHVLLVFVVSDQLIGSLL